MLNKDISLTSAFSGLVILMVGYGCLEATDSNLSIQSISAPDSFMHLINRLAAAAVCSLGFINFPRLAFSTFRFVDLQDEVRLPLWMGRHKFLMRLR